MQANANRRCETCLHWSCDRDMTSQEDWPDISGQCLNERRISYLSIRYPHHGINCDGWKKEF